MRFENVLIGAALLAVDCAGPAVDKDAYRRALEHDQAGRHEEAVAEFDKAIDADPRHPAPRNGRGIAYMNAGRFKSALRDFDEAIRLDPDYYLAYYNRGSLLSEKLGDHARGIEDLDRCIALKGDLPQAYQNRGKAYLELRDRDRACLNWRKACDLGLQQGCASVEVGCSE